MKKPKLTVGRREIVDFPQLGLSGIEAKIDTGAYTSSLHCNNVKEIEKEGDLYVSFSLTGPGYESFNRKSVLWPVYKQKRIKNSFGHSEKRYVIKTKIMIYDMLLPIELTLADRSLMEYPVLLGRKILKKGFIVDVTKLYWSVKKKKMGTGK